jgi:hypothetical protein
VRAANNVCVALRRAPFGWDQGLLDGDPIVRVQAIARRGGRLRVPFDGPPPLLKPRVPSYLRQPSTADLPGPAKAQAPLTSPSIAWVLKHEPRGRPFTVPASPPGVPGLGRVLFSRSIQPDPDSPFRVTVALTSGPEHWGSGTLFWGTPSFMNLKAGRLTLCVGGAGPLQGPGGLGGCEQRRWAGSFFPPGHPISIGPTAENPQIQRFSGIAADGVREIDVYLASGRVIPAALRDNVYTVEVPTAQYPAKFVAYDARHRAVMVYVWPDIRPSVLTPCPRATEPGPVRQPKPYERIDLGTGKVNGWQILGKAPSQVEAALGRPAAGHGKASLNAGFLYGGRGDGRFGRPPALIVAFAWYGHQLRADTLWYGGHPDLVDARLGHVLRLQPSELQRRITAAYGSAYRLSVGYGSEPGQFGCTAIFHSRHGRVELSFGVSPWLPTAQGRSRPFLVLRSPY